MTTTGSCRPTVTTARPRRQPLAERVPRLRARRTNNPLSHINMGTAYGRRVADLARGYIAALGHPTDEGLLSDAVRAAELVAIAEKRRAEALGEGHFDVDQLTKLENLAARAVRKLGIRPTARKPQTLAEAVAEAQRAREAAEAAEATAEPPSADDPGPHTSPRDLAGLP